MHRCWSNLLVGATILICGLSHSSQAGPTFADEQVEALDGVGITQNLEDQVPLDLSFVDAQGNAVTLAKYINGEKPIIITLNYYMCPMLCSLTLNGLTTGMKEMKLDLGSDFEIVTVSINPDEKPPLALKNQAGYLKQYDREGSSDGWHFLTGDQKNITTLADTLGFGYVFDPKTGEYLHTSSIMFLTPDGKISRYMNDVKFQGRDLRLALVEASEGKIGSLIDTFLLFNCYQYDPDSNSFTPSAWKLMRMAGIFTLVILAGGIFILSRMNPTDRGSGSVPQSSTGLIS
ncbi:MAG: SCO family protein [Planctomycetes bacterium]|nr:SCO family protein [Planctomycetota bacterium]